MISITKKFINFPFAHRQPSHPGHCHLIHGHNWSFEFEFGCEVLEPGTGFVVDFGALKWLRAYLEEQFDHTLVLNSDDPWLPHLQMHNAHLESAIGQRVAKIVEVPNCGAEGLAVLLHDVVNGMLAQHPKLAERGVCVTRVVVYEDEKNAAVFTAPSHL